MHYRLFLSLFFLLISSLVQAQIQPDTLNAELDDIVVVGYQGNRSLLETPGSVSTVRTERISGFDNSSLLYGLNTVPGVRMEERATGSYRISIRGSSLRAPFGIRNVKVYWNGIPFTEPTGTTFLNLLDVTNMQQVEVIKGPSGSLYGAGNGGTLLINSTAPRPSKEIYAGSTIGSYDALRYNLGYYDKLDNGFLTFKYTKQTTGGYREQSSLDRRVIEISGDVEYAEDRRVAASILYSDLDYGIPGGLTFAQFQKDPTQARPGNPFVLGSVEADAGIKHEALLLGITHSYQFTEEFSNESSAFGTFSDFENPFNLDYKIDSRKSGGVRSMYTYETELGSINSKFSLGTELQSSSYAARNYGNIAGEPDTLNFDDELKVQSHIYYVSAQLDFPDQWFLNAGMSYNTVNYDINRLYAASGYGDERRVVKKFDPQLIPRIGLAKKNGNNFTIHGSVGFGFSPPTIEEVRTNEGSINLDLEPEKGTNYEIGFRGNLLKARFGYDVAFFYYKLEESIVQRESERGTVLFRNAGSTNQQGIEVAANYLLFDNYSGFFRQSRIDLSYTFHHFEYDDYQTIIDDTLLVDYSGNQLPGIAPHTLFTSFDLKTAPGLYLNLSYTFSDEIPLTDDNSVYSEAWHLVQTRIGLQRELYEGLTADIYFGIDNLLDEQYSLGYDINAFGNRFYQPAPQRNWFAGIKMSYSL